jgi:hypothetical protein
MEERECDEKGKVFYLLILELIMAFFFLANLRFSLTLRKQPSS